MEIREPAAPAPVAPLRAEHGPEGDGWGYSLALESIERYGLTWSEYHAMLDGQERMCAICKRHHAIVGMLVIDHDHEAGNVRGLLCQSCNLGLGHFRDRPDLLDDARDYLMSRGCEFTRAIDDPKLEAKLAPFTESPDQRARRLADLPTRTLGLDLVYHAPREEPSLVELGDEFHAFKKRWEVNEHTDEEDDGTRFRCRELSFGHELRARGSRRGSAHSE